MQFGGCHQSLKVMMPDIEEIVVRGMNGLCGSCVHHDGCAYRINAGKVVIQCEVFESSGGVKMERQENALPKGLCLNCSKSHNCHLPKEASGVWHCEEYE